MATKLKTAKCLRSQPEFSRLDKSRNVFLGGITLLVVLFVTASIFYISTHVGIVEIGYEINQANVKKQKLIEENKLLSLKIARLRSPVRIEREANEQLELTLPNAEQIVYLKSFKDAPLIKKLAKRSVEQEKNTTIAKQINVPKKSIKPEDKPRSTKKVVAKVKTTTAVKASKNKAKALSKTLKAKPAQTAKSHQRKQAKQIIVAKIISHKNLSTSPSNTVKAKRSRKSKESVPAILLDPMP